MSQRNDFAVFVLCHGRPRDTPTWATLEKYGYTGKRYIVCDDEDETLDEYKEIYGAENVLVFSKDEIAPRFDPMDSTHDKRCAVYARNACFDLARKIGVKYFCELDDDYVSAPYRWGTGYGPGYTMYRSKSADLDSVFDAYIDFLDCSPFIYSVALGQPGDFIGGTNSRMYCRGYTRKCMNSWICDVDKPLTWNGTLNDDTNLFTLEGHRGKVFLSIPFAMFDQPPTQIKSGGMTDLYKGVGTYTKSFYTILCCPSFIRVYMMGDRYYRMHHEINWEHACPKIISGKYKKS